MLSVSDTVYRCPAHQNRNPEKAKGIGPFHPDVLNKQTATSGWMEVTIFPVWMALAATARWDIVLMHRRDR